MVELGGLSGKAQQVAVRPPDVIQLLDSQVDHEWKENPKDEGAKRCSLFVSYGLKVRSRCGPLRLQS
jgi:hypothetical protein